MLAEIDILNRQEFIDKIISTVEYHSKSNLKASFSIQGEWGCGKSWILDRVFENLYNIQDEQIAGGRYCVFSYNAWKYDYYDEPLVSLLISLKEQLESENSIIFKTPEAQKNYQAVKLMLKEKLLDNLDVIQKNPLFSIIDSQTFHIPSLFCFGASVKKEFEKYKDKVKEEIRQYDPHYDLNQLMNSIIKGLNKISSEKTVVVIVDELDRCLPEHAIKVLERMHHISQNVNNIQFIYGIDKTQIENNVAQIFFPGGFNTGDPQKNEKAKRDRINKYLSKFITFGLQVPRAEYTVEIEKKYPSLLKPFAQINTFKFEVAEKLRIIATTVSPRVLEQAISKIILTNDVLNQNDEKLDNSILVFELFFAIAVETSFDLVNSHLNYDISNGKIEMSALLRDSYMSNVFNNLICISPVIDERDFRFQRQKYKLKHEFEDSGKPKALFESAITFYFDQIQNRNVFYFYCQEVADSMNKNVEYIKRFCEYYKSLNM